MTTSATDRNVVSTWVLACTSFEILVWVAKNVANRVSTTPTIAITIKSSTTVMPRCDATLNMSFTYPWMRHRWRRLRVHTRHEVLEPSLSRPVDPKIDEDETLELIGFTTGDAVVHEEAVHFDVATRAVFTGRPCLIRRVV